MNEAKGSWNGYFFSPDGSREQFTLRQEDEQSDKDFILRVQQYHKTLAEQGWDTGPKDMPQVTRREVVANGGEKSIPVESIQLAAGGDHPRWVVKGGKFKKFGITAWPEVLEAAGIHNLDPLKENKPKIDVIAFYSERQNDEGNWVPDKVTRLVKA